MSRRKPGILQARRAVSKVQVLPDALLHHHLLVSRASRAGNDDGVG